MEKANRYCSYFIFQSMEIGSCFKVKRPKYPTEDPDYRMVRRQRQMYTYLFFSILLHPGRGVGTHVMVMCVGTYLPLLTTYYLNGHHYIENELKRLGVASGRTTMPFCR